MQNLGPVSGTATEDRMSAEMREHVSAAAGVVILAAVLWMWMAAGVPG
jgi:hypothetical protein